jgi:hypothetical protein
MLTFSVEKPMKICVANYTEGVFLRRRKETLLINTLKPSLNDK